MKVFIKIISWNLAFIFFAIAYVTFIERNLLITKTHNITVNEKGEQELRVVQFTDTQLGEYYNLNNLEKAVKKINKLNADIVVFTGDLIDNASIYDDLYNVSEVLKKIECNIGKYAIYGNHDYGGGASLHYENIMNEAGFEVLTNENRTIEFNNQSINIFGADDGLMGNQNSYETMYNIDNNGVNLLLLHEPDLVDQYIEYPIDLVLSGHSHGGQIYIPFYGPLKTTLLAEKYTKGVYNINNERGTMLYVNSGLGNTKLPFRFGNIPEVSLFKLKV